MENSSGTSIVLWYTREYIMGRQSMNTVLWESLQLNHSFYYSPEHPSTLGKNSANALTEKKKEEEENKKPSVGTLSSQCEYTQERNTITIINSENSLKGTLFNLTEHMRTSWLGNI